MPIVEDFNDIAQRWSSNARRILRKEKSAHAVAGDGMAFIFIEFNAPVRNARIHWVSVMLVRSFAIDFCEADFTFVK